MSNYTITEELHNHHKKINELIDLVNNLLDKVQLLEEEIETIKNGGSE